MMISLLDKMNLGQQLRARGLRSQPCPIAVATVLTVRYMKKWILNDFFTG